MPYQEQPPTHAYRAVPLTDEVIDLAGFKVPARGTFEARDVTITVAWNGSRFVAEDEMRIRTGKPGEAITREYLEKAAANLDNLISNAVLLLAWRWAMGEGHDPYDPDFDKLWDTVKTTQSRRKITGDYLKEVARIYASNPDKPAAAVAEQLDPPVSRAHASRLIRRARDAGLLPEVVR